MRPIHRRERSGRGGLGGSPLESAAVLRNIEYDKSLVQLTNGASAFLCPDSGWPGSRVISQSSYAAENMPLRRSVLCLPNLNGSLRFSVYFPIISNMEVQGD